MSAYPISEASSGIISGIQAGKFKDAQEAAAAAEAAARAEGITDDEWLETARAEAAAVLG